MNLPPEVRTYLVLVLLGVAVLNLVLALGGLL